MKKWFQPVPIYVTRKNAEGYIGTYTMGSAFVLPVMVLASANAMLWGAYGLFEVIRLWVHA